MVKKIRLNTDITSSYISHIDWSKAEKLFEKDKLSLNKIPSEDKKRYPYSVDILKILAAGTVIGLSFAFPTLPIAVAPFFGIRKRYQYHRLNQTIHRLKRRKLVQVFYKDGATLVKITQDGKVKALEYKLGELMVNKPKSWDKKWRIVIFDIPEKFKKMRNIFRDHLKALGFYQLQESVWVHPYPCFNEVEFLRQIYNVGMNVRYIIADKIEEAEDLFQHFNLS